MLVKFIPGTHQIQERTFFADAHAATLGKAPWEIMERFRPYVENLDEIVNRLRQSVPLVVLESPEGELYATKRAITSIDCVHLAGVCQRFNPELPTKTTDELVISAYRAWLSGFEPEKLNEYFQQDW